MQVMATTLTLGPSLRAILTVMDYRAITYVLVVLVIMDHMMVEAVGSGMLGQRFLCLRSRCKLCD